ncbi:MAG: hypothetical protein KBA75_04235 [Alphaproteobacteria bacterium]|nr:hypothetical protein [Alphaproteobacteria bacterium]
MTSSRPFAALSISLALLGGSGAAQAQTADGGLERFARTNVIAGQGAATCHVSVDYMRQAVMNQPMFSGEVTRDPATGKYAAIFIERPSQKDSPRFAVSAEELLAPGRTEAIRSAVQRDCVGNFSALKNHERAVSSVRDAMRQGGTDTLPQASADSAEYTVQPIQTPNARRTAPAVVAPASGATVTPPPPPPTAQQPRAVTADEFKGMSSDARAMIVQGAYHCQVSTEVMRQAFEQTPMFTGTIQRNNKTGELSALFQVPATGEYSRVPESVLMSPERAQALDRAAAQKGPNCPAGYANQLSNMAAGSKMLEVKTAELLNRNPNLIKPRGP